MSLGVERCKDQTSSDFKIKSNSPGKTWCVLAEAIIYANLKKKIGMARRRAAWYFLKRVWGASLESLPRTMCLLFSKKYSLL